MVEQEDGKRQEFFTSLLEYNQDDSDIGVFARECLQLLEQGQAFATDEFALQFYQSSSEIDEAASPSYPAPQSVQSTPAVLYRFSLSGRAAQLTHSVLVVDGC